MLGSNCDLKMYVQNLGYPLPLQIGGPKTTFMDDIAINGNVNGLYLRKETRYRQSVKCVDNGKGSPTSTRNFMNFGPQTASNWAAIFYPFYVNSAFYTSLPGFADGDHQTELNHTLCQTADGKSSALEQLGSSPLKKWSQKTFTFLRFVDDFDA